jgi:Leucine-rich repeat (LRR) protein
MVILKGSEQSEIKCIQNLDCTNPRQFPVGEFNFDIEEASKTHIKKVSLTKNKILAFKKNAFIKFTNVNQIQLNGHQLSTIDLNEFRSNSKLTHLDVGFNNITEIQPISDSTSKSINITILKIHNNDLTDISPLCKLKNLEELNLSRNRRIDFTTIMFSCWSKLAYLFLTDTNLKKLNHDYRMLDGCNKLFYLSLMDNDLEMIRLQKFPNLPALMHLNIRNNSLTTLDVQKLKRKFQRLQEITIAGNKWACNYYQNNLLGALKGENITEEKNYVPALEKLCLNGIPGPEKDKNADMIYISIWTLIAYAIILFLFFFEIGQIIIFDFVLNLYIYVLNQNLNY